MTAGRVQVEIEGRVIGKADMSQVREELDKLRDESLTIGGGVAPGAGGGSGDLEDILRALVAQGNVGRGTLDFLSERLKGQSGGGGGGAATPGDIDVAWYQRNAAKMISTITSYLPTARRDGDFQRLLDRVTRAEHYADHSGDDKLIDALKDLRETLERRREEARTQGGAGSAAGGGGGGPTPPPSPTPPAGGAGGAGGSGGFGGSLASWLSQQGGQGLRGLLGGAVGSGAAGFLASAAGRLLTGPVGWVAGGLTAANMAFNAVDNAVTSKNAYARSEVSGFADLARQYGTDRDLMPMFRGKFGWTNADFARFGYDSTQAARVAAIYDRPSGERLVEANAESIAAERARGSVLKNIPGVEGFRRADSTAADMKNDVTSILAFARTTGTDEQQAARLARTLGVAGVGGLRGGNADDGLRVTKLAMAEGIKAGIASSDTMNSLLGFAQRNYAEGRSTSLNGLAAYSLYTDRFNRSGDPTLRGENAGKVVESFTKGIGNAQDPGMQYFLIQALGKLPSADKLGLVNDKGNISKEGTAYEQLRAESPLEAGRYLLSRLGNLDNPALLGQVGQAIDDASGGSTYLKKMMYEQLMPQLSQQQIMGIIGGGGLGAYFSANPKELERLKQGESSLTDKQGGNQIAANNDALRVAERDREFIRSFSSLKVWGNLEMALAGVKNVVANLSGWLGEQFGTYRNPQGSQAGRAGQYWKNPATVPRLSPRLPGEDEVNDAIDDSGQAPTPGAQNLPGGTLAGTNRLLAAMSQKESTNGTHKGLDKTGRASGLFQIMGGNLVGAQGWDKKYLGEEARNADGSLVSTPDQGIAWLRAHPDKADEIGAKRLQELEAQARAIYEKAGVKNPHPQQVAQMVGAAWHRNGGSDFRPFLDTKGKPLDPAFYSHKGGPDGISDFQYAAELGRIYSDPQLRPAAMRGPDGRPLPSPAAPPSASAPAASVPGGTGAPISTPGAGLGGTEEHFSARLQALLTAFGKSHPGVAPFVREGFRSNERQAQLYAQGRTTPGQIVTHAKPGESLHNHGLAGDVWWKDPKSGKVLGEHDPRAQAAWKALGAMAEQYGLMWGGNFKDAQGRPFVDMPHFEPLDYGASLAQQGRAPNYRKGRRSGGYTGDGPAEKVAEDVEVHGREFVLSAEATARVGRQNLEAVNAGAPLGTVVGGSVAVNVGGVVQVNVSGLLPPAAHREIEAATRAYHQQVGDIVRVHAANHAGVR